MADQFNVIVVGGGPASRGGKSWPAVPFLSSREVTVAEAAKRLLTREEPFAGNVACGFLGCQHIPPDRRAIARDAARRRLRPVVAPEPPDPPITRINNPS
jgi:hypothetical protein